MRKNGNTTLVCRHRDGVGAAAGAVRRHAQPRARAGLLRDEHLRCVWRSRHRSPKDWHFSFKLPRNQPHSCKTGLQHKATRFAKRIDFFVVKSRFCTSVVGMVPISPMQSVMQMRPLCITDLPRYTRFTNAFGTSVSKASGDATEPAEHRHALACGGVPEVDVAVLAGRREDCPRQDTPLSAVERPARPHKSAIQN